MEEFSSIVFYAHSLLPARKVYVALNTLLKDEEIPEAVEALALAMDAKADGVIVQDLGLARIMRRNFPSLPIHASTQMCIHDLEGALALKERGFSRVVLARELSLGEISLISRKSGIETEVFIHGALCYGYSGICLFSALGTGRSGNRGRCAYCCREQFSVDGKKSFPFSMKDLSLEEEALLLRREGVSSLKIEGRMKSPLYVAAATRYYRMLLDGKSAPAELQEALDDCKTVFSRASTKLYLADAKSPAEQIIDPGSIGHRGAFLAVAGGAKRLGGKTFLNIVPKRTLEIHDGIQFDAPGRPCGFSAKTILSQGKTVASAPPGKAVDVLLPADAPVPKRGDRLYHSSSQAAKRRLSFPMPGGAMLRRLYQASVSVRLLPSSIEATASGEGVKASAKRDCSLSRAENAQAALGAIEKAFQRSGESPWRAREVSIENEGGLYAPPSLLNGLRRELFALLEKERISALLLATDKIKAKIEEERARANPGDTAVPYGLSVKVRIERAPANLGCSEMVLLLSHESLADIASLKKKIALWQEKSGKIRLALPPIFRSGIREREEETIKGLCAICKDWEVSDVGSLRLLGRIGKGPLSITADHTLYGFNKCALDELRDMGVLCAVTPAECDAQQRNSLGRLDREMVIFLRRSRPDLFLSATRPLAGDASQNKITLTDRRGASFSSEMADGLWHTRQEKDLVLAPPCDALRIRDDCTDAAPEDELPVTRHGRP